MSQRKRSRLENERVRMPVRVNNEASFVSEVRARLHLGVSCTDLSGDEGSEIVARRAASAGVVVKINNVFYLPPAKSVMSKALTTAYLAELRKEEKR